MPALTAETAFVTAYPFMAHDALQRLVADTNRDHTAETLADMIGQAGIIGHPDSVDFAPVGLYLEARMTEAGHPADGHTLIGPHLHLMRGSWIIATADLTGPLYDVEQLIADGEPDMAHLTYRINDPR